MKTSSENKWAFKVLAGNYISEEDLEGLGISADWHLYLSPTEPPSAAECNQQMNAYDLSACPCCGGRATIIGTLKTCEWSAICTMCGLETAHMMQPKDAAFAWNRRFAPDEEGEYPPQPSRDEAAYVLSILVGRSGLARDDCERANECIAVLAPPAAQPAEAGKVRVTEAMAYTLRDQLSRRFAVYLSQTTATELLALALSQAEQAKEK